MKKMAGMAAALAAAALVGAACAAGCGGENRTGAPSPAEVGKVSPAEGATFRIAASFYPVYIMTKNVVGDLPGVSVANIAGNEIGCLHDFQLTTDMMRRLSDADAFVVNGGGMENYLEKVAASLSGTRIIDSSRNLRESPRGAALVIGGHHESAVLGHESDGHDAEAHERNPHFWLSVSAAIEQVKTIAEGLAEIDPGRAEGYRANARSYIAELETLRAEIAAAVEALPERKIVTFHEAFPWFCREFGLEVVAVVEREPGTEPSARELAAIVRVVREKKVTAIFTEPQYSPRAAEVIAREAGAVVYELDPVSSGPDTPSAYLDAMRRNVDVLRRALSS